uniref:t-SNARE coiled-coil homology domain-containing protein n=1 Tax=Salix viminalis TaxID=40686 RepID=A0A6N2KNU8_SALVM
MNSRRTIYTSRICTMVSDQLECNIDASFVYQPSPRIESPLHMIDEQDNEIALEGLQDSVSLLKRLSGDINEEVDNHNLMLDRMGSAVRNHTSSLDREVNSKLHRSGHCNVWLLTDRTVLIGLVLVGSKQLFHLNSHTRLSPFELGHRLGMPYLQLIPFNV